MDTGNPPDISTGKESSKTQTLANENALVENPSTHVQMKPVNSNSLRTLAELLSLIQADCSRYSRTLAKHVIGLPVSMKFDKTDGIIYIQAPPGHELTMGTGKYKGHILLDGRPVTGWVASAKEKDTGKE